MKKYNILFVVLIFGLLNINQIFGQTNDSLKTVKIKIIKEVDGVTTVMDTTYQTTETKADEDIDMSQIVNQNPTNSQKDDVVYVGDEINRIVKEISFPTIDCIVNDNGTKVYVLRNPGDPDLELFSTAKNKLMFDNTEINFPTFTTEKTEEGTSLVIRQKKTIVKKTDDNQTQTDANSDNTEDEEEMRVLIKSKKHCESDK